MTQEKIRGISRRSFLKVSTLGLAAMGTGSLFHGSPVRAVEISGPALVLEPDPVVRVMRWHELVASDEVVWAANTRRWEQETGGKVITDYVPYADVRAKAAMEAAIGAGHDIVLGWYDDPHLYRDKLLDLTDIAEYLGAKYGGWYPVCEVYGRDPAANRWIALPICSIGHMMNYRISHVREAGFETLPDDMDGLLKCCKALKAKGHYTGFALGHGLADANVWTHGWLWAFGGKAVEEDGKTVAINSKETAQALDAARELYETMIPGVENWGDVENNQAMLAGRISLTTNGISIVYAAHEKFPDIDKDLMTKAHPIGPVGRPTELSFLSVSFIFKHTEVPNAAKHYLRFMFEEQQYGEWISRTRGYTSQTLKAFYDLPAWKDDPRITPFRDCLPYMLWNGYAGPLGAASAAAMSEHVIVDMFAEACVGRKTPRDAVLGAEKRLARMYK